MKKKYKVHLRSGTVIKFKADDFKFNYNENGITSWEAPGVDHWFSFMPSELVAVERIK